MFVQDIHPLQHRINTATTMWHEKIQLNFLTNKKKKSVCVYQGGLTGYELKVRKNGDIKDSSNYP